MIDSTLSTSVSFLFGIILGLILYGGLWITLKELPHIQHPRRWILLSYGLRIGTTLWGVSWVERCEGDLFFCIAGLFLVRSVLIYSLGLTQAWRPDNGN